MRPLVFTYPYAAFFWLLFAIVFAPEWLIVRRAQRTARQTRAQDRGSFQLIIILNQLGAIVAFAAPFVLPRATLTGARHSLFWTGLGLLVGGGLLRRHCFRMLGSQFTGAVTVGADHEIVERGAYRWVRHPSYTAGILMFLGLGLALANWVSILALATTITIAYSYRVRVEERALRTALGERYDAYMRRTKRFVPLLF